MSSESRKPPNPILQRLTRGEHFPNLAITIVFSSVFALALSVTLAFDMAGMTSIDPVQTLMLVLLFVATLPAPPIMGALTAAFTARDLALDDSRLVQVTLISADDVYAGYAAASIRRLRWLFISPIVFWPVLSVWSPFMLYYLYVTFNMTLDRLEAWVVALTALFYGSAFSLLYIVNMMLGVAVGVAFAIILRKPAPAAWSSIAAIVVKMAATIGLLLLPVPPDIALVIAFIIAAVDVFLIWVARRIAVRSLSRVRSAV